MRLSNKRRLRLLRYGPGLVLGSNGSSGLILTRRCNMNCRYCSIRNEESDPDCIKELSAGAWCAVIDKLRKLKVRQVILTGGEPSLYPDVVEVARHAHSKMLVSMVSNGLFLIRDDPLADSLLKYIDVLSLSVDAFLDTQQAPEGPTLDRIAGFLDAAGLLREMIITITKQNIGDVSELVRFLGERGWSTRLSLVHAGSPGHPFRGDGPGMAPGAEDVPELEKMAVEIEELRSKGLPYADSPEFLAGIPLFVKGERTMPCPAGQGILEIDADGAVQPCQDSASTGLTLDELLELPDPNAFLRQSRSPSCRCHYSNYHRLGGADRKIRAALARVKAIFAG